MGLFNLRNTRLQGRRAKLKLLNDQDLGIGIYDKGEFLLWMLKITMEKSNIV